MLRKRHPPAGAQPGTLVVHNDAPRPRVRVVRYRPGEFEEWEDIAIDQLSALRGTGDVAWIDVEGVGNETVLRQLAAEFGVHLLALEDVVNVPQRPKAEPYDQHTFIITRGILPGDGELRTEQISLFVGDDYVLTFQEHHADRFAPVRARIRQGGPIFRNSGPGYLAYAIIDIVLDSFYPLLESIGESLEQIEDEILAVPHVESLRRLHQIKRDLLELRRAVWPQREMLAAWQRDERNWLTDRVRTHLRDCTDHISQLIDAIESARELAADLIDLYLSTVGQRQNEVMKVLTVVASVFIPLTFLAGIYGMNFENMPELHTTWGYPTLLAIMGGIAIGMLIAFRRMGWLGRPRE